MKDRRRREKYRAVVMATVILFDVFIPSRNPHVLANSEITDNTL